MCKVHWVSCEQHNPILQSMLMFLNIKGSPAPSHALGTKRKQYKYEQRLPMESLLNHRGYPVSSARFSCLDLLILLLIIPPNHFSYINLTLADGFNGHSVWKGRAI